MCLPKRDILPSGVIWQEEEKKRGKGTGKQGERDGAWCVR